MSAPHKVEEVTIEVLRTFNYNTAKVSVKYTYTGNNPSGFSKREIDALTEDTLKRGDVAIEKLKSRLSAPVTVKQIQG